MKRFYLLGLAGLAVVSAWGVALAAQDADSQIAFYALQRRTGFMRVRHFGFLANRCRARRLGEIRDALAAPPQEPATEQAAAAPFNGYPCPKCRQGHLRVTATLAPQRRDPGGPTRSPP